MENIFRSGFFSGGGMNGRCGNGVGSSLGELDVVDEVCDGILSSSLTALSSPLDVVVESSYGMGPCEVRKGAESALAGTGAGLTDTASTSPLTSVGSEREDRDQNPIIDLNDGSRSGSDESREFE